MEHPKRHLGGTPFPATSFLIAVVGLSLLVGLPFYLGILFMVGKDVQQTCVSAGSMGICSSSTFFRFTLVFPFFLVS